MLRPIGSVEPISRPGTHVTLSPSASITQARIWKKILEFVRLPLPLFPVGRGLFFDLNIRPDFRVFCIQRQPFLKPWLDISLDGIDGTLRLANATVDTFGRVDDEHILALVEAVHGAHCNAVHGFAANTAIVDDVSQFSTPNSLEGEILAKTLPEGIQLFGSWAAPKAYPRWRRPMRSASTWRPYSACENAPRKPMR